MQRILLGTAIPLVIRRVAPWHWQATTRKPSNWSALAAEAILLVDREGRVDVLDGRGIPCGEESRAG